MTHDTNTLRRLSPWNPLDHCRLLWWVLVTPQHLLAYREAFGEEDERRVGKWLASTLIWSPFFLLSLAFGLDTLPLPVNLPSAIFFWLSCSLALTWVLTGWLGKKRHLLLSTVVVIVVFVVATFYAVSVTFIIAGGLTLLIALLVAGFVAGFVASVVTGFAIDGKMSGGKTHFVMHNVGSLGFRGVLQAGVSPASHIWEQDTISSQIRGWHTPFEQFTPRNPKDP